MSAIHHSHHLLTELRDAAARAARELLETTYEEGGPPTCHFAAAWLA